MLQKQKSLLTKCLAFLFIICCSVVMVLGMTACSSEKTITSIKVEGTTLILTWSDGSEERIETKGDKGDKGDPGQDGANGKDAVAPVVKIGDNGNWFIDDADTGVAAKGDKGDKGDKTIVVVGENGNWYIDGEDTGVAAKGDKGEKGDKVEVVIGENGNWYVDGEDTGVAAKGKKGDPGTIITIGENGNWYIDGEDSGVAAKGAKGDKGDPGQNGTDGKDAPTISEIKIVDGKFVFTFSDGTSYDVDIPANTCEHANKEVIKYNEENECKYKTLTVCKDCKQIVSLDVVDDHEAEAEWTLIPRKDCLHGAYEELRCKKCHTVLDTRKDGVEDSEDYTEHQHVEEYVYKVDENGDLLKADDKRVCNITTVKAYICIECSLNEETGKRENLTIKVEEIETTSDHTYGDGKYKIEVMPTASTEGTAKLYCEKGDDEKTFKIPAYKVADADGNLVDNTTDYVVEDNGKPSCGTEKRVVYTYKYSEEKLGGTPVVVEVTVDQTGHLINGKDVGSTEAAAKYVYRYATQDPKSEEVYKTGKVRYIGSSISCDEDNPTDAIFVCDECGETLKILAVKAHDSYVDGETELIIDTKPACEKAGTGHYVCSCGKEIPVTDKESAKLVALEHNWVIVPGSLIAKDDGTYSCTIKCSLCGNTKARDNFTPTIERVPATCTTAALTKYYDEDGTLVGSVEDPEGPLGHKGGSLKITEDELLNKVFDLKDAKYNVIKPVSGTGSDKAKLSCNNTSETAPGTGWFTCDQCSETYFVKVFYSHSEGSVTVIKDATCDEDGEQSINCPDCGKNENEIIHAKGHKDVYTVIEKLENGGAKLHRKCSVCDREEDITVVSYVETNAPTCKDAGTADIKVTAESEVEHITVTTEEHSIKGQAIRYDYTNPYTESEAKELGFTIVKIDGLASCAGFVKVGDVDPQFNAIFTCEVCGNTMPTYVKADHKKPDGWTEPEATCEEGVHTYYTCANGCGTEVEVKKAPLGHELVYSVNEAHTELHVTCTRKGCGMNGDNKAIIKLPEMPKITLGLDDTDAVKAVIADSKYYNVAETNVKLGCDQNGVFNVTFKAEADEVKALFNVEGHTGLYDSAKLAKVSFSITVSADHKLSDKIITWKVGNKTYTGRVCEYCNKVVAVD